jgi:hypothetical protein
MVLFFFYDKLTNPKLIQKINSEYTISDGYTLIYSYDKENNSIQFSNEIIHNTVLLHGKVVDFDMTIQEIIEKINTIEEITLWKEKEKGKEKDIDIENNQCKYKLYNVLVNTIQNGFCKAYIFVKQVE